MKKLFFVAIATVGFAFAGTAQEGQFKAGVDLGLPIGDAGDLYSFNFGVNAAYMWNIAEGFDVGIGAGFSSYTGKEVDGFGGFDFDDEDFDFDDLDGGKFKVETASFIPVYGTAQYSFSEKIFAGADLGYGIAIAPSGMESGLLYQPKVGYQAEKFEVYLGYKGIAVSGTSLNSVNLGFNYKF